METVNEEPVDSLLESTRDAAHQIFINTHRWRPFMLFMTLKCVVLVSYLIHMGSCRLTDQLLGMIALTFFNTTPPDRDGVSFYERKCDADYDFSATCFSFILVLYSIGWCYQYFVRR